MNASPGDVATLALGAGGHSVFFDRRQSIRGDQLLDLFVLTKGSAVVFAHRDDHSRRHKVGVFLQGHVFVGSNANLEIVPVSDIEVVRIPIERIAAIQSGSATEIALVRGIGEALAACGSSLSTHQAPSGALASACQRCASEMGRRGEIVCENAFSRHLRRLVSTASAALSFDQRLQTLLRSRKRIAGRDLPDDRLAPIIRACTQVAIAVGCDPDSIPTRIPRDTTRRPEQIFAHVAALGIRPVFLDPGWWKSGVDALLAFRADDQSPVAILPRRAGFVAFVHSAGATIGPIEVDAEFARGLSPTASQFHATLPHRATTRRQFIRFTMHGSENDFVRALLISGLGTIVNLAIPIATGVLVIKVLPGDNQLALVFLGLVLLGTTLSSSACGFVVSNLLLRTETRMGTRALGGVLDRCLRMPVHAFRQFSSGDLADRILAVGDLQSVISGAGIASIMAGVFSMVYLAVMLAVNPSAGLVGAGLLLVAILASALMSAGRAQLTSKIMEGQGRLSSMVLEFIGGIDTIRGASAEQFATMRWFRSFREIRGSISQIRALDRAFDVFAAAFPMACMMIFWAMFLPVGDSGRFLEGHALATPERVAAYLVFNSAFVTALYAVLELGERLGDLATLRSMLRRIDPILEAPIERMGEREQPGTLSGQVEITDARFTYPGTANEVLTGVSIRVEAGESVAIVGPSGSGKSTLLQLLLGLRMPTSGGVMYDGKALDRIDLVSVRRQIGAVVQNTRVIPGTILENIVGSTLFTAKHAEAAIEAAGFDAEVGQMPMGVHTYVTDQTLSGGQVQKLMIARALVTRPRILIFDEATSALDEISQSQVVRSLERLNATRIIVAHRLSTVRTVKKIYVMDSGKVVQSGSYSELIGVEGPFKELAKRQMIDSKDDSVI